MMRWTPVFAVATAFVVASAGCGGQPTESTTAPTPPPLAVPPVAQPLDVTAFAADPCGLLDESQRGELGLPAAYPRRAGTCDLHVDAARKDSSNFLRLAVFDTGGLADQYARCDSLDCATWTVDTLAGYPVILANDELASKYGSCKILVGVADDATVTVIDVEIDPSAQGPDCARAERAVTLALATLR